MKAETVILTGVHRPPTILGVPPALLVVAVGTAAMAAGLMIMLDAAALSLVLGLTVLIGLWVVFYRWNRRDHHVVQVRFMAPAFWRGKPERRLIAGEPLRYREAGP